MSDAAPRPGFLAGFLPTFSRALRTAVRGKRAIVLVLALSVPPLVAAAFGATDPHPWHRGRAFYFLVTFLDLNLLVPLCGLLYGTGILQEEEAAGNLPYLFTRPVPRSSILLARYAAFLLVGWLLLAVSVALTIAASGSAEFQDGMRGGALAAALLAYPAYLAFFALLSTLTKWSVLGGFFYAFGLEGFLGLIPGMVRKATLLFYSRSLLGEWTLARPATLHLRHHGGGKVTDVLFVAADPAEPRTAVTVLVVFAAAALVLAALVLARRQFAGRNPGRG